MGDWGGDRAGQRERSPATSELKNLGCPEGGGRTWEEKRVIEKHGGDAASKILLPGGECLGIFLYQESILVTN